MNVKRVRLSLAGLAVAVLLTPTPTAAHHAFAAEFDANRPIAVKGVIARVDWINPHAWIHLDVKNEQGQIERWMFELTNVGALSRRGITKSTPEMKPGTELSAEGFLSKGQPRRANGRSLKYADGRTMFVGSSGTGAPDDGLDASETKKPRQ
jgi:hypothetical protein